MEGYVSKYGVPLFAMDDVEIVLDELCSGYDKATESRMRKELFDHYQSAFDDAVGVGLGEEDAHEKVMHDLGWETTLMMGKMCAGMSRWRRDQFFFWAYKKVRSPQSFIRISSLFLILFGLFFLIVLKFNSWYELVYFTTLGFLVVAKLIHTMYGMNHPSSKILPNRRTIKKRCYMGAMSLAIMPFVFSNAIFFFNYPEIDADFIKSNILTSALIWSIYGCGMCLDIYLFFRKWDKTYPQDRIF